MKKTYIKENGEYQQVYKAKMPEAYARVEWCKQAFGGEGEPLWEKYRGVNITRGLRWWRRQGHLFFRSEQDYVFYCLRWGSSR
jgi:hypothetical protein